MRSPADAYRESLEQRGVALTLTPPARLAPPAAPHGLPLAARPVASLLNPATPPALMAPAVDSGTYPFTCTANQSAQIATLKPGRRYLLVQNNTAGVLYLAFGRKATTADLRIAPGDSYEPWAPPRGSVNVLSAGGGAGVLIQD